MAMPRPAISRISVATMGWIFSLETRKPFHTPHRAQTSTAIRQAGSSGILAVPSPAPPIREQQMAPEMAMTEPWEMSMPPVAMTKVMPMDKITRIEARLRMSIMRP